MDEMTAYRRWRELAAEDSELQRELEEIESAPQEIHDRFYRDLAFGTGGLRGLLGAGPNRMNIYTVRRATQGLADYLNRRKERPAAAIAYDSRINSQRFAQEAARVLAANGVKAWLYPRLEPTPALSFAVRNLGCDAGICVTASHNPAAYNGYKVYGPDGCQITLEMAEEIQTDIGQVEPFEDVRCADFERALEEGRISYISQETLNQFVDAVLAQRVTDAPAAGLRVVYTPLNGTGRECVLQALQAIGVEHVQVVPEQERPDGHFPTCPYPNPEVPAAMALGLALCRREGADLLLATDPDCDRVGVALPDGAGEYKLITGNEVGVLLLDWLCQVRKERGQMPQRPVAVTTIVSTPMADPIAEAYGVELRRVLTGFKFIGEQIGALERAGETERFLFGFEESCGYLSGPHVRDKDGVNAAVLLCDMAAWYRRRGLSLSQVLDGLYQRYGWYRDGLISVECPGSDGMARMAALMAELRSNPPAVLDGHPVVSCEDYTKGLGQLPPADVFQLNLAHGGRVIVRPSGTEPKIKAYLSVCGQDRAQAAETLEGLTQAVTALLKG